MSKTRITDRHRLSIEDCIPGGGVRHPIRLWLALAQVWEARLDSADKEDLRKEFTRLRKAAQGFGGLDEDKQIKEIDRLFRKGRLEAATLPGLPAGPARKALLAVVELARYSDPRAEVEKLSKSARQTIVNGLEVTIDFRSEAGERMSVQSDLQPLVKALYPDKVTSDKDTVVDSAAERDTKVDSQEVRVRNFDSTELSSKLAEGRQRLDAMDSKGEQWSLDELEELVMLPAAFDSAKGIVNKPGRPSSETAAARELAFPLLDGVVDAAVGTLTLVEQRLDFHAESYIEPFENLLKSLEGTRTSTVDDARSLVRHIQVVAQRLGVDLAYEDKKDPIRLAISTSNGRHQFHVLARVGKRTVANSLSFPRITVIQR